MHKLLWTHTQQTASLSVVLQLRLMIDGLCFNPIHTVRHQPRTSAKGVYSQKRWLPQDESSGLVLGTPILVMLPTQCYSSWPAAVPARISFGDLMSAFSTSAASAVVADGQIDSSQLS